MRSFFEKGYNPRQTPDIVKWKIENLFIKKTKNEGKLRCANFYIFENIWFLVKENITISDSNISVVKMGTDEICPT